MDWSPLVISLKTATASIILTFFLGTAMAELVFRLKNKKLKMILDGIFTLPSSEDPLAGFSWNIFP